MVSTWSSALLAINLLFVVVTTAELSLLELELVEPCTPPEEPNPNGWAFWYSISSGYTIPSCKVTTDEYTSGVYPIGGKLDRFQTGLDPTRVVGTRSELEFAYLIFLQSRCTYYVEVTMRETEHTIAGERLFDITANNVVVARDIDLYAEAGSRVKAVTRTFEVVPANGILSLYFSSTRGLATVSGVTIFSERCPNFAAPRPPPLPPTDSCSFTPRPPNGNATAVALMNVGGEALCGFSTDGQAMPGFEASFSGGFIRDGSINGTANPLRTLRVGMFNYSISINPNATYFVRLTFAESYWSAPTMRVLNVYLNDIRIIAALDPWGFTGGKWRPYTVTASWTAPEDVDSMLLRFVAIKDLALVNMIEVYRLDEADT